TPVEDLEEPEAEKREHDEQRRVFHRAIRHAVEVDRIEQAEPERRRGRLLRERACNGISSSPALRIGPPEVRDLPHCPDTPRVYGTLGRQERAGEARIWPARGKLHFGLLSRGHEGEILAAGEREIECEFVPPERGVAEVANGRVHSRTVEIDLPDP